MGASPEEGVLMGRPSKYSPEFREQAVELVKATGKTVAEVARDLSIYNTTLGNWVKADRAERGEPDSSGLLPLTPEERAELTRLRRENAHHPTRGQARRLRLPRDVLQPPPAALGSRTDRTGGLRSTAHSHHRGLNLRPHQRGVHASGSTPPKRSSISTEEQPGQSSWHGTAVVQRERSVG